MKIKSVRARVFEWKGKTVPPQGNFCSNAMDLLYSQQRDHEHLPLPSWTVVEIETDDGIVGLGNVALAPKIAKAIIDEYLAPLVIGQDPWDYEYLWQRMYRATHAWGRKGVTWPPSRRSTSRSGTSWARRSDKPVFKLLGGRTKEKIPCYYSKLYRTDLKEMQAEAQKYLNQGFTLFKIALRLRPGARHQGRGGEPEGGRGRARSDRLRQRPDARVLHGLERRIRQAHPAQAREVPAALAGGAGDRRRHRRLCRAERS